jgi:hypothetical protein
MSKIVYCEEVVHQAKLLQISEAPRPHAEIHLAFKVSYPIAAIKGAIKSESGTKHLCPRCFERIEADLEAIVSGLGDKVTLRMEVSTI